MTENKPAEAEPHNAPEGCAQAMPAPPPELPAQDGPDGEDTTPNTSKDGQGEESQARIRLRLSTNEILTLLVAVASLFVSFLTYRTSTDTSDIKHLIGDLASLAKQTKRQADNSDQQLAILAGQAENQRRQTAAMQSQTDATLQSISAQQDNFAVEQRPMFSIGGENAPGGPGFRPYYQAADNGFIWNFYVRNTGRTTAYGVTIVDDMSVNGLPFVRKTRTQPEVIPSDAMFGTAVFPSAPPSAAYLPVILRWKITYTDTAQRPYQQVRCVNWNANGVVGFCDYHSYDRLLRRSDLREQQDQG